jgi:copper chaperone
MTTYLTINGMTCDHCEQTVTEALESVNSVTHAAVNRTEDRAVVEGTADTDTLIDAVENAGYSARIQTDTNQNLQVL